MNARDSSVAVLIELISKKAPEYLDLMTSKSDQEFESAFDALLAKAIIHLERNKINFKNLDEEGLTAALAGKLSIPGLSVIQEANSNGHVDITIEVEHCYPPRIKLGEAKIYDGPIYHCSGLSQLIGRYSTGRESRGLLISYVRTQNIDNLVQKIRAHMDKTLPESQKGKTIDHSSKWCFLSRHDHSSGVEVEVEHVGCNMYFAELPKKNK